MKFKNARKQNLKVNFDIPKVDKTIDMNSVKISKNVSKCSKKAKISNECPINQVIYESNEISDEKLNLNETVKSVIIPKACYINGTVRLNFDKKNENFDNELFTYIETEVLVDTGCVSSAISKDLFDKLKVKKTNAQLKKSNIGIRSCTGNVELIAGMTKVRLHFQPKAYVDLDVMISDKLTNDFILGYDFLGSNYVKKINKMAIILNEQVYRKKVEVPLVIKEFKPLVSFSINKVVIDPFATVLLPIEVKNLQFELSSDENVLFTLKKSKIRNLSFLPTVFSLTSCNNSFLLPVRNESCNELFLSEGDLISEVETLNMNYLEFKMLDCGKMELADLSADPILSMKSIFVDGNKVIKVSKSYNEEERTETSKNFLSDGFFQPPVTDYIKDKSSITEVGLIDDKPLTTKEFLEQFDISNLSNKHKKIAHRIFIKNKKAFAMHQYDIGRTNLIEMNIPIENKSPKMQKFIPIPLNAKEKVRDILDQLKKYDIIRPCNEPSNYCSNILVIKKRDGKSIRLLFDGRLLNYDTKRLPMATVSKPEILSHLVNKVHLTSLDFADAFFHIPLDKESQPLTAFYSSVHSQRFCFTRAPQGLRNSPLYLKLLLDKVFSDMADSCILFFDDLLIATDGSLDEHMKIVDKVLQRIIKAGLKLRPKKLNLAKEHVEFLGMVFEKGKISIPDAKLEAFNKLPSPNSPKKAKSLICALSFYRNFVPDFAGLSREIMELSNINPKQFKWTNVHETKLRKLIKAILDNSKLYLPDPTKRFYVQTDSSTNCGGGRVYQRDDEGNEKLIAAVSRTYTKTERGYSIFKKEILALLYTLKSMDYFLRFADQLTILIDAKSIVYLRLAKDSSGILLRFSLELSKYNAEIYHVSGEENIISDVLSRHNDGINEILEENLTNKPLTEKETLEIIKKLTLPKEFSLTSDELKILLNGPSPVHTSKTAERKSKAMTGNRNLKNTPATMVNKKLNLPQLSMRRPGIILPKRPTKNNFRKNNIILDNNVLTRSKTKTAAENSLSEMTQADQTNGSNSNNLIDSKINGSEKNKNLKLKRQNLKLKQKIKGIQAAKKNKKNSKAKKSVTQTMENVLSQPQPINIDPIPNVNENIVLEDQNLVPNTNFSDDLFVDLDIAEENLENVISYSDVENVINLIHDGVISIKDFKKAQQIDPFCINVQNDANEKGYENTPFEMTHGILFRKTGNKKKPVLPEKLIDVIINIKHYSIFGAHATPTRINREIKEHFFVPQNFLLKSLKALTASCYICQLFNDEIKGHFVSKLPKPNKPRVSWSMDIISNMQETENNNSQILLCVDDFSGYVICIPIKDATSKSIINALRNFVFMPFGIPQSIRCDEQASFYNSAEFYNFMKNYNVELCPTAVAAPYSNGRAESAIKNIKKLARKFLYQEHCISHWDDYLSILTSTHNSSIGIYGYSAEQIMFATNTPKNSDLLTFDWALQNEEEIINKLFEKAENTRQDALKRMETKAEQNRTYKNSTRILKKFEIGALVLYRQLQVSTGKGSDYKPKFTGPYVITSLNNDENTAFIEHIRNKSIIKAHFSNLQALHFNPLTMKYNHSLPENLIYDLQHNLNEKTKAKGKKNDS